MNEIEFLMYEADEKVVVSILENTTQHGALQGKTQTKDVLFIDSSKKFEKGENKNHISDEDIDEILEAYRARKDVDYRTT